MKKSVAVLKEFVEKNRLKPMVDVVWFAVLLFGFHFLWKYWENSWDFRLFTDQSIFIPVFDFLTKLVFNVSDYFVSFFLGSHYKIIGHTWHFENGGYVEIVNGCSGLKASFQYIVIILFFSGPFKHKLWYIPMGLILLFIGNIIRITGLTLVVFYYSSYYLFTHNYIFRPFFYGIIFILWVIWVEYFRDGKIKNIRKKRKSQ